MFAVRRRLLWRRSVRSASKLLCSRPGRAFTLLVLILLAVWLAFRLLQGVSKSNGPVLSVAQREAIIASYNAEKQSELRQTGHIPLCRAPHYPTFNVSAVPGIGKLEPCPNHEPLLLLAANRLVLNDSNPLSLNVTRCRIRAIEWRNDNEATSTKEQEFLPHELGIQVLHDFVLAQCDIKTTDGGTRSVQQVLVQASPKDYVHRRIVDQRFITGKHKRPDVLIVVIGDVDVQRRQQLLPKTMAYLDLLNAVDIPGLTGLSYDIEDNVVPLLTGRHLHELPNARRGTTSSQFVDIFNFIWYDFEKQGYATLLAEDVAESATFNKELHGFEQSPTDHYMRPFWLEMERAGCIHGKHRHEYTIDFVRDFFLNYHNVSKLAMLVHHPGIEGNPESVSALDEPLGELLATLAASGEERNLAILLLGLPHKPKKLDPKDLETMELTRRLSLGQIVLPGWFIGDHRGMMENLVRSTGQMVTYFDLNLFLRDLMGVGAAEPKLGPAHDVHAHSLLQEMIRDKNCPSAGVPLPWCTCVRHDPLSPQRDSEALRAMEHLISRINILTESYRSKCVQLSKPQLLYADLFTPKTKDTIRTRGGPVHIREEEKITTYYFHLVIRAEGSTFSGVVGLDKLTGTFNTFTESIVCLEHCRRISIKDNKIRELCVGRA